MNYQKIIKYNNLRQQLTPEEIVFANALHEATDTERELLVESLSPEKVAMKRAGKKPSKSTSKSSRASGIAATLNRSLSQQRRIAKDTDDESSALPDSECRFVLNDATRETCGATKNDPIHDMRYLSSHEFESRESLVQPVAERSSTNGGETSGTANSGAEPEMYRL